jgi:hypothetical protein
MLPLGMAPVHTAASFAVFAWQSHIVGAGLMLIVSPSRRA